MARDVVFSLSKHEGNTSEIKTEKVPSREGEGWLDRDLLIDWVIGGWSHMESNEQS